VLAYAPKERSDGHEKADQFESQEDDRRQSQRRVRRFAAGVTRPIISYRERCRRGRRSTPSMGVVVSSRRRRDPISQALGITLPPPFRQSVAEVRLTLEGRERALFDLLCVAGHLGRSLPNAIGNRRTTRGPRDPRRKLARIAGRMTSGSAQEWAATSARAAPAPCGWPAPSWRAAAPPRRARSGRRPRRCFDRDGHGASDEVPQPGRRSRRRRCASLLPVAQPGSRSCRPDP